MGFRDKAGPRRVKLALCQAAKIARRWDPQPAKIYHDQLIHKGKPHYTRISNDIKCVAFGNGDVILSEKNRRNRHSACIP